MENGGEAMDGGGWRSVQSRASPSRETFLEFSKRSERKRYVDDVSAVFRKRENPDNPGLMGALFPENALSLISAKN